MFCAANLALGEIDDPWDPRRSKEGRILDWTPNEQKSLAGKQLNRRELQLAADNKIGIDIKWIPLMLGPTEKENVERPKELLRDVIYKMQKECPLELVPMDVKTYVRWDGVKDFEIDGHQPAFMPSDLEILSCASKRENDTFLQMGAETLKLAELLIMETTEYHRDLKNKTREEPLLGFQIPRVLPYTGETCTGRVLSETLTFEAKEIEARTGVKLYSMWEVKQTLVVKEHQMEDPDVGMYMIPVLHIDTIIAKTRLGRNTPILIPFDPEVREVNAMWDEVHLAAAARSLRETWTADEPWKFIVLGRADPQMSEERKQRLIEQGRSNNWIYEFQRDIDLETQEERTTDIGLNLTNFLLADRTKNPNYKGEYGGMPLILMLTIEWNQQRQDLEDRKPAAKRSVDKEQSGPNKTRRFGHENLLEEGSVEEAKGVARGSSDGRSSA
jgi:hypothetical protein